MNRLTGLRIMIPVISLAGFLWVGFFSVDGGCLWAQARRPEIPRERLNVKATVKGLPSGLLHVVTADGEQWLVRPPENPQDISYEGSAEVSWLRPRMLVQFHGTFDAKGNSLEPVDHLTVFTLREGFQIGVFADSQPAAASLFSDEGNEQGGAVKPKGRPFLVAGRLVSLKGRKLTVAAGNRSVTVDLANETKVSVNVADYRLAREGDQVDLRAWYFPTQKGRAVAQRITITSRSPLGSTEAKKPSRPQRQRTRKNSTPDPSAPAESKGRNSSTDDDPSVRPPVPQ